MNDVPLLWDQHCCLPLSPAAEVGQLLRFQEIGASFVSANVGYAPTRSGASSAATSFASPARRGARRLDIDAGVKG
jgi:hypothetical protein